MDVARAAGVSHMTVSRVLRGERYVKAETARRVEAALEQLGYRTNPMIQALMSSVRRGRVEASSNIAWVEERRDPARRVGLLREGARKRARGLGYGFEEIYLDEVGPRRSRLAAVLRARGVSGVLLAPMIVPGTTLDFPWDQYAVATIGSSLASPGLSYVMMHHQHAMERSLRELRERGYRRIAFCCLVDADRRAERWQLMTFLDYNFHLAPEERVEPLLVDGLGTADLVAWFKECRPDAVLSSYPDVYGLLSAGGVRFPEDAGYATLSWRKDQAHLCGICPPAEALGACMVDLVVGQIYRNENRLPESPKTVLVEGTWQEGITLRQRPVE